MAIAKDRARAGYEAWIAADVFNVVTGMAWVVTDIFSSGVVSIK